MGRHFKRSLEKIEGDENERKLRAFIQFDMAKAINYLQPEGAFKISMYDGYDDSTEYVFERVEDQSDEDYVKLLLKFDEIGEISEVVNTFQEEKIKEIFREYEYKLKIIKKDEDVCLLVTPV